MPTAAVAVIRVPARQAMRASLLMPGSLPSSLPSAPSLPAAPPTPPTRPANSSVRSETLYSQSGTSGLIGKVVTVPPPINTLGEPSITCASQLVLSPTREAGWPLMLTLSEPCAICMLGPSSLQATWLLVASAAGLPLMKTLGEPVTILPLGVRLPAPASAMPSRAAVAASPVRYPTARLAPMSSTPTPIQEAARPATNSAPAATAPAAAIRPPTIVPAIMPARAWECPMVSPTRAASVIVRSFYAKSSSLGRPVAAQHLLQQRVVLRRQLARHRQGEHQHPALRQREHRLVLPDALAVAQVAGAHPFTGG
ncbi:Uncharacterised protein [Serratia marcescens]|nr:Uncharacterised protein [Serratia marcescens]CVB47130.1 Uncharacterised protein [Serratia marcescens]CVB65246.1 Uncharacterised protein [Serratia marcescens]CVE15461.1 Uncharacterised protein [Serratia marcescens]